MAMKDQFTINDVGGRVADRLTVLLGLNALLVDGAFGSLQKRQEQALMEMLQTTEELIKLLEPAIYRR
ncbi:MAG TPA: hypothetical protein VMU54_16035 [Planctomycetota bacterium]|nr:hypothetical protein [Planctomycetota bacterium]